MFEVKGPCPFEPVEHCEYGTGHKNHKPRAESLSEVLMAHHYNVTSWESFMRDGKLKILQPFLNAKNKIRFK